MKKSEKIKGLTVEEFYSLDEVSVESDGFYYVDDDRDIKIVVPTPDEAFLPEEEWNGEDYSDHLHPAYLDAWEELQDLAVDALDYWEYLNDQYEREREQDEQEERERELERLEKEAVAREQDRRAWEATMDSWN